MHISTNINKIREDFPILNNLYEGKRLIYFDNAATSQKPSEVIEAEKYYYEHYNANVHRGLHDLSLKASELYEQAHVDVKKFINAKSFREIIFVKNATEALNLVAYALDIKQDDEIVLSIVEHHSNFVPWQLKSKNLKYLYFNDDYFIDEKEIESKITPNTKILALQHASNVFGNVNNIKNIIKIAREINPDIITVIDGAQSAPHLKIDVRDLDCDFFAFTGHKMIAPTGTGILYGKEELLTSMKPFLMGGDTIKKVTKHEIIFADPPHKYEAGTPNIAGAVGLSYAINYLTKLGMENIQEYEEQLTKHFLSKLKDLDEITLIGPKTYKNRLALFSFHHKHINCHDLAMSISNDNYIIALRSGYHCAQPLFYYIGINGSLRASLYFYNTKEEIDILFEQLDKVVDE